MVKSYILTYLLDHIDGIGDNSETSPPPMIGSTYVRWGQDSLSKQHRSGSDLFWKSSWV